jgi:hypothetical protein
MQDVPPPEVPDVSFPWAALDAKREEREWEHETALRGQETKNQVWFLRAYGIALVVFLIVFAVLFLGSLASWSLHYLLPEDCHWLTPEQLSKIQSVLFSGSIGGVISILAQKHLSK